MDTVHTTQVFRATERLANQNWFVFWGTQTNEPVANPIIHDWSDGEQQATQNRSHWADCVNFRAIKRVTKDAQAERERDR